MRKARGSRTASARLRDTEHIALHWRRTKIIATLGPASSTDETLDALLAAGVDLVRLNMSHGDHASHRERVARIRAAAARASKHVAILMDLCGPKIRVGRFEGGAIDLVKGEKIAICASSALGRPGLVPSQYRRIAQDVKIGERILLDDGKLELRVVEIHGQEVKCEVIQAGRLSDNKGMNLPDSQLSTAALTAKDKQDAQLAIDLEVDFLALSFVRTAKDVAQLQRFLAKQQADIPIISKIERPEAVEHIDEIIDASYGIMVARGDLGIELPAERVPLIQNDLIERARQRAVPVIVATQMLESMLNAARPTRAEVGDVANAALSSADAVMLSGETASGKYPVEAVQTMDRILREIENHQWHQGRFAHGAIEDRHSKTHSIREAVGHAAVELARDLRLAALIIPTMSGTTARIMAAHRATAPMFGVCANERICRRIALHWGIMPMQVPDQDTHDWKLLCGRVVAQCSIAREGHKVLVVAGFSEDPALNEPVMKLLHL